MTEKLKYRITMIERHFMKIPMYFCDISGVRLKEDTHIAMQFMSVKDNSVIMKDCDIKFLWIFNLLLSDPMKKLNEELKEFSVKSFKFENGILIIEIAFKSVPETLPDFIEKVGDSYFYTFHGSKSEK